MSSNTIAFFIGLFGSVHCIGMCGPLAFAVPVVKDKWLMVLSDKALYNFGRIITYTALGLLVGLIGRQLWLFGLQRWISILSGALILLAASRRIFKAHMAGSRLLPGLMLPVKNLLTYALQHHAGHLAVGLINGLLPCGFVYMALAGALNTPSPYTAAQFMFWFGMGTFPLMYLATVGSGFIGPIVRRRINKLMPYFMVFLGCWFILRGLNLNIPYLSPAKLGPGMSFCR